MTRGALVGLVWSLTAAYGVFLLYTALVLRWRGWGLGPVTPTRVGPAQRVRGWLTAAGLAQTRLRDLVAVSAVLAVVGAAVGSALFGGALAPLTVGLAAATIPVSAARARRARTRAKAAEAWPRMIEEIRLQATTMGRSVPQALLSVGLRGPEELRPAFTAALREWLISTDFPRTVALLKDRLADATADAVCETLLVAHEVGGTDLDRRLTALAEDRIDDLGGRKDAAAKQAGARFARFFVLIVPLGMALAGWSIGEGRAAYATPTGQAAVLAGLAIMFGCWVWAGRLMVLPTEQRVFGS